MARGGPAMATLDDFLRPDPYLQRSRPADGGRSPFDLRAHLMGLQLRVTGELEFQDRSPTAGEACNRDTGW